MAMKKNDGTEQQERSKPLKVLFLASNPRGTEQLRLDVEIREIKQALLQSALRDQFILEQEWAVRVSDLQGHLLRHQPDIVHFSGHGSTESEILLEDESGDLHPVPSDALAKLFQVLKDNVKCVVLNACYSIQQGHAIAQNIDSVIGMSRAISDSASVSFAMAFYRALGFDRNIKTAFDLGCLQIDLEILGEQDTPQLLAKDGTHKTFNPVATMELKRTIGSDHTEIGKDGKKKNWKWYAGVVGALLLTLTVVFYIYSGSFPIKSLSSKDSFSGPEAKDASYSPRQREYSDDQYLQFNPGKQPQSPHKNQNSETDSIYSPKHTLLSSGQVEQIIKNNNLYDKVINREGNGIQHKYRVESFNNQEVVIDEATDLVWQQSGSSLPLSFEKAVVYVESLRRVKFAGYKNWRLPTLPEALALLESEKKNANLAVSPLFDATQKDIWTSTKSEEGNCWTVSFVDALYQHTPAHSTRSVRAVCVLIGNSSQTQ